MRRIRLFFDETGFEEMTRDLPREYEATPELAFDFGRLVEMMAAAHRPVTGPIVGVLRAREERHLTDSISSRSRTGGKLVHELFATEGVCEGLLT